MAQLETVRDLLTSYFGVIVAPRYPVGITVQTTRGQLVKQDPARIGLAVVNDGAADVQLFPAGQQGAARAFILGPGGGSFFAWWQEDGELPAYEWEALAVGAASAVLVVEVVIQKNPEEARP